MIKKIIIGIVIILLIQGAFIIKYRYSNKKINIDDKYYNNGEYIEINNEELDKLDGNFIVFIHNGFCSMGTPCEEVFKEFMEEEKIDFLKIHIDYFKDSKYFEKVKYSPSVAIISSGKVIAYLDSNSNKDNDKYQDVLEFKKWITKYIELK